MLNKKLNSHNDRREPTLKSFKEAYAPVKGGVGFIKSYIVDRLMQEGAEVHVLDDMSKDLMSNLNVLRSTILLDECRKD